MNDSIDRVNAICNNSLFQEQLKAIAKDERDRKFCKHGMDHLLDVARLSYIYYLESLLDEKISISDVTGAASRCAIINKDIIYAAALLHDIGRHCEYETGEPHHKAGVRLARVIMSQCGYQEFEIKHVSSAISSHRENGGQANRLGEWLYRADKSSRKCFACEARNECNWSLEKMNLKVNI